MKKMIEEIKQSLENLKDYTQVVLHKKSLKEVKKEKIHVWLKENMQDYFPPHIKITDDLIVNIDHDVILRGKKLTRLKVRFGQIGGNFDCSQNELISLKGCPETVFGHFSCADNNLTDLLGGPKQVLGAYDCSHNKLASLQGIAEGINDDLNISYNKLTTLEHGPVLVKESFHCIENQLKNMQHCPHVGRTIYASENPLNDLTDLKKKSFKLIKVDNTAIVKSGLSNYLESDMLEHSSDKAFEGQYVSKEELTSAYERQRITETYQNLDKKLEEKTPVTNVKKIKI